MTMLGLNCLLENLIDEQPMVASKKIKTMEIIEIRKQRYLQIVFEDGDSVTAKLYEGYE